MTKNFILSDRCFDGPTDLSVTLLIINNILLDVFTSCCSSCYILNKSVKTSKISLKSSYFEFLSARHLFLKCFIMQCPRSGVVFLLVIVSLFLPPTVISPSWGEGVVINYHCFIHIKIVTVSNK